jgi:CMP-N,N'-diacetyllegionaminic acid synthase
MKTLCVIPVRGGSKGIPRKSLAHIVGCISLLEWTIHQALAAYSYDEVFVSTEDEEMSTVAAAAGARTIPRPAELAQDTTPTIDVVDHALGEVDPSGAFEAISILQVTSPLRTVEDILRSRELLATGRYDSVVSAYEETTCHPAKMYFVESEFAIPVAPIYEASRRQELPPVFRRNGAIFLVTTHHYRKAHRLWGGRTALVHMPRERSIDIDTLADLEAARLTLFRYSDGALVAKEAR